MQINAPIQAAFALGLWPRVSKAAVGPIQSNPYNRVITFLCNYMQIRIFLQFDWINHVFLVEKNET